MKVTIRWKNADMRSECDTDNMEHMLMMFEDAVKRSNRICGHDSDLLVEFTFIEKGVG